MAKLFLSHSGEDDAQALALQTWLRKTGWAKDDIYLDINPDVGMVAGQRWIQALDEAQRRCEAILFLISKNWLSAKWCREEYDRALQLNKRMFALIIDDEVELSELPLGLLSQWQAVSLAPKEAIDSPTERFDIKHPITNEKDFIRFSSDGLIRLKNGLTKAAIAPDSFALQKDVSGPLGWRSPYRGLEPLEADDAVVFFGRDAEIAQALDLLRGLAKNKLSNFMVVLGASGAGKSSFLRAGLLPRLLRDDVNWLPMNVVRTGIEGPIESPEGLLTQLYKLHVDLGVDISKAQLREKLTCVESFINCLASLRNKAKKNALLDYERMPPLLVLPLDQAEELFVSDAHYDTDHFLDLIRHASLANELLCVATIRSDRYSALQSANALEGVLQTTFSLPPVSIGQLSEIINKPALIWRKEAGPAVPLFAPEVSSALMAELKGQQDALPLLAFSIARLMSEHIASENVSTAKVITLRDLEVTGGVAKTIELEANKALNDAGISIEHKVREGVLRDAFIPRLARVDSSSRNIERRVASLSDFEGTNLRLLLNAFIQRRLLTLKEKNGHTSIEVAHEALLRKWPTLSKVLEEEAEDLIRLDGVLSSALQWNNYGRRKEYIDHRGGRLADIQRLQNKGGAWSKAVLNATDYISSCQLYEKSTKFRRRLGLAGLFGMLFLSMVGFAAQQKSNLSRQRQVTITSLDQKNELLIAAANREEMLGNHTEALLLVLEGINHNTNFLNDRNLSPEYILQKLSKLTEVYIISTTGLNVQSVQFEPKEQTISAITKTGDFIKWGSNGYESYKIENVSTAGLRDFSYTSDGTKLIIGSDSGFSYLTNQELLKPIHELVEQSGRINATKYGHDGRIVATGSSNGTFFIWNGQTGEKIWDSKAHEHAINALDINKNSTFLATASSDFLAKVWSVSDEMLFTTLKGHTSFVNDVSFSPNGKLLATASADGTARIWNAKSGKTSFVLKANNGVLNKVKFSLDGLHIFVASESGPITVWDTGTGELVKTLKGHTASVNSLSVSDDGKTIISYGSDDTIRVWNWKYSNWEISQNSLERVINFNSFDLAKNVRIATYSSDPVMIVSTETGESVKQLGAHRGVVNSGRFSNDKSLIVTSSNDATAIIWDRTSGNEMYTLSGHSDSVVDAVFSPDDSQVATASWDGKIKIWNAGNGNLVKDLVSHQGPVNSLNFDRNGHQLISSSMDNTAVIWNLRTWEAVQTLTGHTDDVIYSAFHTSGNLAMTVSKDGLVKLWDTSSGVEVFELNGMEDKIIQASFDTDDEYMLTKSDSGITKRWKIPFYLAPYIKPAKDAAFNKSGANADIVLKNLKTNWSYALAAKVSPRCLNNKEREYFRLSENPPCWCEAKPLRPAVKAPDEEYKKVMHDDVKQEVQCSTSSQLLSRAPWEHFEKLENISLNELLDRSSNREDDVTINVREENPPNSEQKKNLNIENQSLAGPALKTETEKIVIEVNMPPESVTSSNNHLQVASQSMQDNSSPNPPDDDAIESGEPYYIDPKTGRRIGIPTGVTPISDFEGRTITLTIKGAIHKG